MNKIPQRILSAFFVFSTFFLPQAVQAATPITNTTELQAMRNDLAGDYYLANDIDASESAAWNSGAGFEPVGTRGNAFHGKFDGKGFEIRNLHINRPSQDYVGLFGSIESAGTLSNIKLKDAAITGKNNVGAVSGYLFLSSITTCSAAGTVSGTDRVGGVIGESYNGEGLRDCSSNTGVSGNDSVGGIVGKLWDGNLNHLTQNYAFGTVNGNVRVGGLAGYSKSGDLIKSYAIGNVTGQDYVGGLVGQTVENAGIHNSFYSNGTVSGVTNRVGGIAGHYNSYDDGISNTYFAGKVISSAGPGGFLGVYQAGTIANNYWDSQLNPGLQDSVSPGDLSQITAADTASMKQQSTYTGWDFTTIWIMSGGYPQLIFAPIVTGPSAITNVTELQAMRDNLAGEYYLANDIDASASAGWNNGAGFEPVGTRGNPFHGKFDGKGFEIRNLTINRPAQDYVGLFGSIESAGTITSVKLKNISITGKNNTGAISGYFNLTRISNCYAENGSVSGADRVGGLFGESYNGNGIDNCDTNVSVNGNDTVGGIVGKLWDGTLNNLTQNYALGTVNGTVRVGGLAGYSKSGDLIKSYAIGNVTGQDYVGGLVGQTIENAGIHNSYYSGGRVSGTSARVGGIAGLYNSYDDGTSNTYFAGTVTSTAAAGGFFGTYQAGTLASNYWDSQLNPGLQDSAAPGDLAQVTASTTSAMKQQSTYIGWDFTTLWVMSGYPRFGYSNPDVTKPVCSLTISGGNFSTALYLHLVITYSDAGGTVQSMRLSTNGGSTWNPNWIPAAGAYDLDVSTLPDGPLTVTLQVMDLAGNESLLAAAAVTLDRAAPTGTITIAGTKPYTLSQSIQVNLTAADNVSPAAQIQMRLLNETGGILQDWTTFSTPVALTLAKPDGKKKIVLELKDQAGNIASITPAVIFLGAGAYLAEQDLAYLDPANRNSSIHVSGYPHEGFNQTNYTQPTNIGFYAQLLANIISGDLVTDHVSVADARAMLRTVVSNLLADQANNSIAYQKLLPWMHMNSDGSRVRDSGTYGEQVSYGDNSNLAASLMAAVGALLPQSGDAFINTLITDMRTFITNQKTGFQFLITQSGTGTLLSGWRIYENKCVSPSGTCLYMDRFGSEFRSGVLFTMIEHSFADSLYKNLKVEFQDYQRPAQDPLFTLAPFDGAAFQIVWPGLTMPEIQNAKLTTMLNNYLAIAKDYATNHQHEGFLSSAYTQTGYDFNLGIAEISSTGFAHETTSSLYTLGAAHMADYAGTEALMDRLYTLHPDIDSGHGLWEGVNETNNTVVHEQIIANVASFVLGIVGKGPDHMMRYYQLPANAAKLAKLQSVYASSTSNIDLITQRTPATWNPVFSDDTRKSEFQYSGDELWVNSPRFNYVFLSFVHPARSVPGMQLKIQYKSTTSVGPLSVEFKENTGTGLPVRAELKKVTLQNTAGALKTILIDLPVTSALQTIHEFVLVFDGNGGQQATFQITDFDIVGGTGSVSAPVALAPAEEQKVVLSSFLGSLDTLDVKLQEIQADLNASLTAQSAAAAAAKQSTSVSVSTPPPTSSSGYTQKDIDKITYASKRLREWLNERLAGNYTPGFDQAARERLSEVFKMLERRGA